MRLVERHVIKRTDPRYNAIDCAAFDSKNLYNKALYVTRKAFFADGSLPTYPALYHQMKGEPAYAALPLEAAQWVLKQVCAAWDSYKEGLSAWEAAPSKFLNRPRLPQCQHKQQGRNLLVYTRQALSVPALRRHMISPSGLNISVQTHQEHVQQVRIVPQTHGGHYVVEVIYQRTRLSAPAFRYKDESRPSVSAALRQNRDGYGSRVMCSSADGHPVPSAGAPPSGVNVGRWAVRRLRSPRLEPQGACHERAPTQAAVNSALYAGVDIGLNNLALLTSNKVGFAPRLVNGWPVKSINQFYNKRCAELQGWLGAMGTSRRLERITTRRTRRIDWYLHTASRRIIDLLVAEGIGTLCTGKNPLWKQHANMGKRNNQNFVAVPHARFIAMLAYKAELVGIQVKITEESYTSKASFLDADAPPTYSGADRPVFSGKRVERGLYRAADGRHINADTNGAYNIIRKVAPDAFAQGSRGCVVHPIRLAV